MQLHQLKISRSKKSKRVGRGNASGAGNYSGRGVKGQSARSGGRRRPGFEGGQTPLIRRMPKLKGFKNPFPKKVRVINVATLEKYFQAGEKVNLETLLSKKLIAKKDQVVKILGKGQLTKKLTVEIENISKKARQKLGLKEPAPKKEAPPATEEKTDTAKPEKTTKPEKSEKPKKSEKPTTAKKK